MANFTNRSIGNYISDMMSIFMILANHKIITFIIQPYRLMVGLNKLLTHTYNRINQQTNKQTVRHERTLNRTHTLVG